MNSVGTVLAVVAFVAILSENVDGASNPREGLTQMMELVNAAFAKCKKEMGFEEDTIMNYLKAQEELAEGDGCGLACIATNLGFFANDKLDEAKIMEEVKKVGIKEDSVMKYLMSQKDLQGDGCGLACIGENLGYVVNGKIDESKVMEDIKKVLPKEEMVPMVQNMIHECVQASSDEKDKCKLVLSYSKCQLSKVKEMKEQLGKMKN